MVLGFTPAVRGRRFDLVTGRNPQFKAMKERQVVFRLAEGVMSALKKERQAYLDTFTPDRRLEKTRDFKKRNKILADELLALKQGHEMSGGTPTARERVQKVKELIDKMRLETSKLKDNIRYKNELKKEPKSKCSLDDDCLWFHDIIANDYKDEGCCVNGECIDPESAAQHYNMKARDHGKVIEHGVPVSLQVPGSPTGSNAPVAISASEPLNTGRQKLDLRTALRKCPKIRAHLTERARSWAGTIAPPPPRVDYATHEHATLSAHELEALRQRIAERRHNRESQRFVEEGEIGATEAALYTRDWRKFWRGVKQQQLKKLRTMKGPEQKRYYKELLDNAKKEAVILRERDAFDRWWDDRDRRRRSSSRIVDRRRDLDRFAQMERAEGINGLERVLEEFRKKKRLVDKKWWKPRSSVPERSPGTLRILY